MGKIFSDKNETPNKMTTEVMCAINACIIKVTWQLLFGTMDKGKLGGSKEGFYNNVISKHKYKNIIMAGKKIADKNIYNVYRKNVENFMVPSSVLRGQDLIIRENEKLKDTYVNIGHYVNYISHMKKIKDIGSGQKDEVSTNDKLSYSKRGIQGYESILYSYIVEQKIIYDKNDKQSGHVELDKIFRAFTMAEKVRPDYEIKLLEKALRNVTVEKLLANLSDIKLLEGHKDKVSHYLEKVSSVLILKDHIKK